MQLEKQIDGLTVTIEAESDVFYAPGFGDYPDEHVIIWVSEPQIIDVHNNYYDVSLTPDEEKEILDNLDINDFVC